VIGVLVSGDGTNLQALLDADLPVVAVASNKPGVRALERAAGAGVPTGVFPLEDFPTREERDGALGWWLCEQGAEIAVLAGYMHILTSPFLDLFSERVINVHPSLLPKYPGAHAIEDALAAGERSTGTTVHFVDEDVDSGPIIAQVRVSIFDRDTIDTVRSRVQDVEHWLLPRCVSLYLKGAVWPTT
jgi:phosphoribosylglycinamide formyltransferase 1